MDRTTVKFTFQDWLELPVDGLRHEVLAGEHVVTPYPSLDHQRVSHRIHFQLYQQIELAGLGEVFGAPAGVRLSDLDVVLPDILVVLAQRAEILLETHVDGAPDLVVEILSKSTARRDRGTKRRTYRKSGVREYWIVDPAGRFVEQYVLEGTRYRLVGKQTKRIWLEILPDVTVDLSRVWP